MYGGLRFAISSAVHEGAARLRFIGAPDRMLQSEYWTNRCTV
jgi:hypothetical protein